MTPVSELLATILDGLAQAGIPYVVMRNYDNYPLMVTGDVDLIVRARDGVDARDEILRVGHSLGWRTFSERSRGYLTYLGLCSPVYPDRFVLVFETFSGGYWYCFPYLTADQILASRRKYGDIWVPSPSDEASLTLFHHLLWNGRVPPKYRARIRELVGQHEMGFKQVAVSAFGRRCADRVLEAIRAADWSSIERDAVALRVTLIATSLLRAPSEVIRTSLGTLPTLRSPEQGLVIGLWSGAPEWCGQVAQELLVLADEWHLFHPGRREMLTSDVAEDFRATRAAVGRAVQRGGLLVVMVSAFGGVHPDPHVNFPDVYWVEVLSDGILWNGTKRSVHRSQSPHQSRGLATLILETVLTARANRRSTGGERTVEMM